jgi:hypothetical protein
MIVAMIALAVALSGTAVAGTTALITSGQIKNGTIQLADISSSAKKALKGQRGPAGPAGAQGIQGLIGPGGAQGPAGGFDPSKITYVTGPTVSVPAGQVSGASAFCPAGTKVIGGGFFSSITDVGGTGNNNAGTSWYVLVSNYTSIAVNVNATAICAAP